MRLWVGPPAAQNSMLASVSASVSMQMYNLSICQLRLLSVRQGWWLVVCDGYALLVHGRNVTTILVTWQINITVSVYLQDFDHLYDPCQQKVSLWSGQRDITGFCLLLWGPRQRQSWRPSVQHPPGHLEPCEHHHRLIWCAKQRCLEWDRACVHMFDSAHYVHCGTVRFCTLCSLWYCDN